MGAALGSQNALGNKGGGRASAYQEKQDAAWHSYVWQNAQDITELEAKIASGVYSGRDMAALMMLKGNERLVTKFMDKLVPDLHDIKSDGEALKGAVINIIKPEEKSVL